MPVLGQGRPADVGMLLSLKQTDNRTTATGSFCWTPSYSPPSRSKLVTIPDNKLAQHVTSIE